MVCKRPCFLYRSLINHPKNFGETEDISVDKNVFENKLELVYDPRSHSVGKISFAGHLGNPAIYGSFESVHRTADVGSSMDTFLCG